MMRTLVATAAATAITFVVSTTAFIVSSPSSDDYWVSNHTNTLNWKANATTDAEYFSVQLLNANQSSLIGNFQVGNALTTANGTAQIALDAIPAGQYTLLLVNSSNYELNNPQVYYTSGQFEIKPNGTQPADVQANSNATPDDNASTHTTAGSSPDATLSAKGQQPTNGSNSAADTNAGAVAFAVTGTLVSVVAGVSALSAMLAI